MKWLPLLAVLLPLVYGMCMCRIRYTTHDIANPDFKVISVSPE